jgi:hypothetical protein
VLFTIDRFGVAASGGLSLSVRLLSLFTAGKAIVIIISVRQRLSAINAFMVELTAIIPF